LFGPIDIQPSGGGGGGGGARSPLGNPELFYALTLSIYSVGEFIGSILFGVIFKRFSHNPKAVLMSCIFTGLLGAILFVLAGLPSLMSPWLAFAGRLVQGLWTGGQQVIEQAYLSENVRYMSLGGDKNVVLCYRSPHQFMLLGGPSVISSSFDRVTPH
jgi:MFS family permease